MVPLRSKPISFFCIASVSWLFSRERMITSWKMILLRYEPINFLRAPFHSLTFQPGSFLTLTRLATLKRVSSVWEPTVAWHEVARRGTNALFDPTTASTIYTRNKEYRLVFMGAATINAKRYLRIIICAPIMKDNKAPRGISDFGLVERKPETPLFLSFPSLIPPCLFSFLLYFSLTSHYQAIRNYQLK